jgi:hypothetical protein
MSLSILNPTRITLLLVIWMAHASHADDRAEVQFFESKIRRMN